MYLLDVAFFALDQPSVMLVVSYKLLQFFQMLRHLLFHVVHLQLAQTGLFPRLNPT